MWRVGQLLPAQILACALAWQEPFRQAEGEPIEWQSVDRSMILGRKHLAQVVERIANRSFVQSLKQQQRGK